MVSEVLSELKGIKSYPEVYENTHQSVFRSHQALQYIMKMVERGDSKETIWDVYYFLAGE